MVPRFNIDTQNHVCEYVVTVEVRMFNPTKRLMGKGNTQHIIVQKLKTNFLKKNNARSIGM